MLAINDQFSHQMRNRLKTTGMGLGLVRLLQDVGLNEEARTTLYSLENGVQDVAIEVQDDPTFCPSPKSFYVAKAGSNTSISTATQLDTSPFDSAFWSGHPPGTVSPRR